MALKRSAKYLKTLVYMDEPQVVLFSSGQARVVGIAVPEDTIDGMPFVGVTVSKSDWQSYLDGSVDLRYLFTYPIHRSVFQFDLSDMKAQRVWMHPIGVELPEKWLPAPRFFSTSHTEPDEESRLSETTTRLLIDGEWDMPDLGMFYNRYSDVYYFLAVTDQYSDDAIDEVRKRKTLDAFQDCVFKGGFSYVNFYDDLAGNVSRSERLNIDKIKYESPGYVTIHGDDEYFDDLKILVEGFLENREKAKKKYGELHSYLSKGKFLPMAANTFANNDSTANYIMDKTNELAVLLNIPNLEAIRSLVNSNALAFAKIVLSFHRRLEDTSKYFAQGRIAFG
jgi:hypothetical protein